MIDDNDFSSVIILDFWVEAAQGTGIFHGLLHTFFEYFLSIEFLGQPGRGHLPGHGGPISAAPPLLLEYVVKAVQQHIEVQALEPDLLGTGVRVIALERVVGEVELLDPAGREHHRARVHFQDPVVVPVSLVAGGHIPLLLVLVVGGQHGLPGHPCRHVQLVFYHVAVILVQILY